MRDRIQAEIAKCEWEVLEAQAGVAEHSAALENSDPQICENARKMVAAFTQREANMRARQEFWAGKLDAEP